MSASTEPMTAVKRHDASAVKGHYQRIVRHRLVIMGVIVLAILASLILDFTMGPSGLSLSTLWQTLWQPEMADAGTRVIVWDIRLPYALMAIVVGLALGLAGAEMQTILNNPLRPLVLRWLSCWVLVFLVFPTSGLFLLMPLFSRCSQR